MRAPLRAVRCTARGWGGSGRHAEATGAEHLTVQVYSNSRRSAALRRARDARCLRRSPSRVRMRKRPGSPRSAARRALFVGRGLAMALMMPAAGASRAIPD